MCTASFQDCTSTAAHRSNVTFWYFFFLYRNNQPNASLSDLYIDANVQLQTSTSKSLPNTPKNEQLQIKRRRTRASSAVVNAEHRAKNDFHGLDAYLERKRMERHSALQDSAASKDYSDDKTRDEDESYFEYRIPVPSRADTRLRLSDDNFPSSFALSTQNEGKSKLSGRYPFSKSLCLKTILRNHSTNLLLYFHASLYMLEA